jgi:hypothetical protein
MGMVFKGAWENHIAECEAYNIDLSLPYDKQLRVLAWMKRRGRKEARLKEARRLWDAGPEGRREIRRQRREHAAMMKIIEYDTLERTLLPSASMAFLKPAIIEAPPLETLEDHKAVIADMTATIEEAVKGATRK